MDEELVSSFWGREPVRALTKEETEILRKIENKIEKNEKGCFIHPVLVRNRFEKKQIQVCPFVFGIFFNKDASDLSKKEIYTRCNQRRCVNPAHMVKITQALGLRLQKIGWEHFGKPEKEIIRICELQTLLKLGKRDEMTGCLLYTGCLNVGGYGHNKQGYAHRRRWQLENPEVTLTPDICVRHKCQPHRHCFEIDHLEIGTPRDNSKDMRRDGTLLIGENHPNAKLTKDIAQVIKDNYDNETQKVRADRYDICPRAVSEIDCGINWGYLPYRGEPDTRREAIAETKYDASQRRKQRIPSAEDYENVWKRI